MIEDFSKNLIKKYKYWDVYIHPNQSYLGRCIVWCKRNDVSDLTNAIPEEQQELFLILGDLKKALETVFQADWFNYVFLGNETRHLHGHLIPRYKTSRKFNGILFEDKFYGHNYRTDHDFKTSRELLEAVRDKLSEALH